MAKCGSPTINKLREVQAENAQLRALLGAEKKTTEDSWGKHLSQELRDQFAARALIQEWGDAPRALLRLGFELPKNNAGNLRPEAWELADRIFKTPGCQEILNRDLADLEAQKQPMLQRLMQIAQTSDDTNAVRAAGTLAKIMGLNKADQGALPTGATANIFIQMGNANGDTNRHRVESIDTEAVIDATDFLVHEPGEAIVIEDNDEVAALHA